MNATAARRSPWRAVIGWNVLTGIVLGVAGFYLGWWVGHQIHAKTIAYFADTNQNDVALMFGYLFFVIGFLVGLGFAKYPLARMLGREPSHHENEEGGLRRYFGVCTDHKVVGLQYIVGIGVFFFIGGLNAMLIRAELLQPSPQLFGAGNYLTIVGLHGAMMMGVMSSAVLGPFANYLVPLMIGARRMAFPRLEALSFWLLMAAGTIFVTTIFFGGFPTGWTGYAPLSGQANMGMDSYIVFFALVGISMCLLGLNMIATVVTMRAPGMTWGRLPIFVWGVISTSTLMLLAAPVLISTLLMLLLDRTAQTGCFNHQAGGSAYL
jgi:cytochrome c oxidase subunit 1